MTSVDPTPENAQILACTISRDVENFDLLIEDMETVMGEAWGDLSLDEAAAFLSQPEASGMEFVAIAMDDSDEEVLPQIETIISSARQAGIKVILVTENVSANHLHQLLRLGAEEFLPYPLPEGELASAVARLRTPAPEPAAPQRVGKVAPAKISTDGVVLAVQGMAGGTGSTTMAVNLAWELANMKGDHQPRVALLDMNHQFGSVATYLDLPRRDAVHELLSDVEAMDDDAFCASLVQFEEKLNVLTAPPDILPMDYLTQDDVTHLIETARQNFDYVVIDMPSVITQWTDVVLNTAHVYFAMLELEMRSAQNTLRLKRVLQAEDLPFEKMRFILNRAPKFTDLTGRSRIKRLAESLGISIEVHLPDGGKPVMQACDHGQPLAESAAKNPLRKEIVKLATQLHQLNQTTSEAA
ncbi:MULTISPECIES: AAA family ATPase [Donghicola]|jgi:pilus assembly protein CpaE|uniref:AAA family ATPase n=1 Tax=Donghicola TaxID=393277 RepID=UPI0008EB1D2B|nr:MULTISPECIES: AAA family ATPase [Donghicola]MCT4578681.1 AAA family ATPase [Donghicola sp.]SFQ72082.1 response regulator receiver protein [Donghicola eburneus]